MQQQMHSGASNRKPNANSVIQPLSSMRLPQQTILHSHMYPPSSLPSHNHRPPLYASSMLTFPIPAAPVLPTHPHNPLSHSYFSYPQPTHSIIPSSISNSNSNIPSASVSGSLSGSTATNRSLADPLASASAASVNSHTHSPLVHHIPSDATSSSTVHVHAAHTFPGHSHPSTTHANVAPTVQQAVVSQATPTMHTTLNVYNNGYHNATGSTAAFPASHYVSEPYVYPRSHAISQSFLPHCQYLQSAPLANSYAQSMQYTPAFSSPSSSNSTVSDGQPRVRSACSNCRAAKCRCDSERPCRRCKDKGKEKTCVDAFQKKRGPKCRSHTVDDVTITAAEFDAESVAGNGLDEEFSTSAERLVRTVRDKNERRKLTRHARAQQKLKNDILDQELAKQKRAKKRRKTEQATNTNDNTHSLQDDDEEKSQHTQTQHNLSNTLPNPSVIHEESSSSSSSSSSSLAGTPDSSTSQSPE